MIYYLLQPELCQMMCNLKLMPLPEYAHSYHTRHPGHTTATQFIPHTPAGHTTHSQAIPHIQGSFHAHHASRVTPHIHMAIPHIHRAVPSHHAFQGHPHIHSSSETHEYSPAGILIYCNAMQTYVYQHTLNLMSTALRDSHIMQRRLPGCHADIHTTSRCLKSTKNSARAGHHSVCTLRAQHHSITASQHHSISASQSTRSPRIPGSHHAFKGHSGYAVAHQQVTPHTPGPFHTHKGHTAHTRVTPHTHQGSFRLRSRTPADHTAHPWPFRVCSC